MDWRADEKYKQFFVATKEVGEEMSELIDQIVDATGKTVDKFMNIIEVDYNTASTICCTATIASLIAALSKKFGDKNLTKSLILFLASITRPDFKNLLIESRELYEKSLDELSE